MILGQGVDSSVNVRLQILEMHGNSYLRCSSQAACGFRGSFAGRRAPPRRTRSKWGKRYAESERIPLLSAGQARLRAWHHA
jgi:hypothetical protein